MGGLTFDCHPRFDERTHKVLTALSQATGEPINKIAGDWLNARAEEEAHKAKKIVACLLTCEGRGGTRGDAP